MVYTTGTKAFTGSPPPTASRIDPSTGREWQSTVYLTNSTNLPENDDVDWWLNDEKRWFQTNATIRSYIHFEFDFLTSGDFKSKKINWSYGAEPLAPIGTQILSSGTTIPSGNDTNSTLHSLMNNLKQSAKLNNEGSRTEHPSNWSWQDNKRFFFYGRPAFRDTQMRHDKTYGTKNGQKRRDFISLANTNRVDGGTFKIGRDGRMRSTAGLQERPFHLMGDMNFIAVLKEPYDSTWTGFSGTHEFPIATTGAGNRPVSGLTNNSGSSFIIPHLGLQYIGEIAGATGYIGNDLKGTVIRSINISNQSSNDCWVGLPFSGYEPTAVYGSAGVHLGAYGTYMGINEIGWKIYSESHNSTGITVATKDSSTTGNIHITLIGEDASGSVSQDACYSTFNSPWPTSQNYLLPAASQPSYQFTNAGGFVDNAPTGTIREFPTGEYKFSDFSSLDASNI